MLSSSKFAPKSKSLYDEEMNKFVNGYIASLCEAEKNLSFLTNHAEHTKNVSVTCFYKLQHSSVVTPRYVIVE